MRKVVIEPVSNGFIVTVGCQKLVFNSIDILCGELKRYQANPEQVEKEYQATALNKMSDCRPPDIQQEAVREH